MPGLSSRGPGAFRCDFSLRWWGPGRGSDGLRLTAYGLGLGACGSRLWLTPTDLDRAKSSDVVAAGESLAALMVDEDESFSG